ncbi:MAG: class I SAM-dependent methyltransferase [Gammaproteobacteria bacterium]|nr:MAG: class I SAM-dependent methyltransferase [Gammaproteobacteria bacterium]
MPRPADPERRRSDRLLEEMAAEIDRRGGWIPFSRYMELALYHPRLGYYASGTVGFGAGGDFVTAPELGPVYAASLARCCLPLLTETGGDLLEIGAGSGALAAALLPELERLGAAPRRYLIVDRSRALRERQQQRLREALPPGLYARVSWLEGPPEAPFDGVILANEVLDALPVERFEITPEGPRLLGVTLTGGALAWRSAGGPDPRLEAAWSRLGLELPVGYRSEIALDLPRWLEQQTRALRRGAALFIDYGYPRTEYYHPQRREGTLICHYRQRGFDQPLALPGLIDLSAFVDFTALAEAADACGLEVSGFASQAHFLIDCGLEEVTAGLMELPDRERALRLAELHRLTHPGEMGERFKVMALSRNLAGAVPGFDRFDRRHAL